MANTDLEIKANVNVSVSREVAERCLRILEMYLDDNPSMRVIGEEKRLFDKDGTFIKHYLHLERY